MYRTQAVYQFVQYYKTDIPLVEGSHHFYRFQVQVNQFFPVSTATVLGHSIAPRSSPSICIHIIEPT